MGLKHPSRRVTGPDAEIEHATSHFKGRVSERLLGEVDRWNLRPDLG